MKRKTVCPSSGEKYDIAVGNGILRDAGAILRIGAERHGKALVVTDDGVPQVYPKTVAESLASAGTEVCVAVLPQGERHKDLGNVSLIIDSLMSRSFTRSDCVVAVGGGVTGDTAGFAASCYMRGIAFYNVPTTLLSQTDSSVGGKTGVNFGDVKNLIGAFYQPCGVLIDFETLETLPARQISNGMAEIIKMAATFSEDLFDRISPVPDPEVISDAIDIKILVVEKDAKEKGLRRSLNFGHTIGHGIELNSELYHGEAVGVGMLAMSEGEARERIAEKLSRCGLPLRASVSADDVIDAVMHDKKSSGDGVRCVLCDSIGSYYEKVLGRDELRRRLTTVLD